jgi:hypothetical protein
MQRSRKAPHPLKLRFISSKAPSPQTLKSTPVEKPSHRQRNILRVKRKITSRSAKAGPTMPTLETRPTAYTLLLEHARRTSILRFTSAKNRLHHRNPTPVPNSILLLHTYFIAPFSPHPSSVIQTSPLKTSPANASTNKAGKRFSFGNLLHFRYPTSNAPGSVKSISQAQVWGSGRLAWAFRRLASPYSIGFLAFAWMSGDLA